MQLQLPAGPAHEYRVSAMTVCGMTTNFCMSGRSTQAASSGSWYISDPAGLRRCAALASSRVCFRRVETAKPVEKKLGAAIYLPAVMVYPSSGTVNRGAAHHWEFLSMHSHHPQSMACQRCAYDDDSAGKQLQLPYEREMTLKFLPKTRYFWHQQARTPRRYLAVQQHTQRAKVHLATAQ